MPDHQCFILFNVDYLSYAIYTHAHTCASCIVHLMRYASWSRDVKDKSWINLKVMRMMNLKMDKSSKCSAERWSTNKSRLTNTNLVLFQASPGALSLSLCFKIFITLYDAFGDRSCVLNNWCISILWKLITIPWLPFIKRIFLMLSLALEKQNVLF
jgi:hypothetical protein